MPLNNAYGAVVLGMDTSNVDTVLVAAGCEEVEGRARRAGRRRLRRKVEPSRDHLLAQAKWPRTVLGGYLPGH